MVNFELGEEIEKDAFCPSQARDKEKIQSPAPMPQRPCWWREGYY